VKLRDAVLLGELTEAKHLRGSALEDPARLYSSGGGKGYDCKWPSVSSTIETRGKTSVAVGTTQNMGISIADLRSSVLTPIFVDLLRAWLGLGHA